MDRIVQNLSNSTWLRRMLENRPRVRNRHEEERARVIRLRPPGLPPTRENLSQYSVAEYPQSRSPLFTVLPPEIRQRIFQYAVAFNIIFLYNVARGIRHKNLPFPQLESNGWQDKDEVVPIPLVNWQSEINQIPHRGEFSQGLSSLLQTCHAAYSEAIGLLYSDNLFAMSSPLALLHLHDLELRPQHFDLLRQLRLHWMYSKQPPDVTHEPWDEETWQRFWTVVAEMRNLVRLELFLHYIGPDNRLTTQAEWVQPMMRVAGIPSARISIRWMANVYQSIDQPDLEQAVKAQWMSPKTSP